jgi:hypothetical protein
MHHDRSLQLHHLALAHGQVRWVLRHLGLRVGDSEAQLDAWLKYVRRLGMPFYPNELGRGAGTNVVYRYHHVMELAVALALRTQGILPADLLGVLAREREKLRPLYYQAYTEADRGLGAVVTMRFDDSEEEARAGGTFLDLRLQYLDGGVLTIGEAPCLLGPRDAIRRFVSPGSMLYLRPPLPLSQIAADVVHLAEGAPELRRGRP